MENDRRTGPKQHNGRPELRSVFRRLADSGPASSTSAFYSKNKTQTKKTPPDVRRSLYARSTTIYLFIRCCCILEFFLPIVPVVDDGVKMDRPTENDGMQSKPVRLPSAMLSSPLQCFPVHCLSFIAVPHRRRRRPPLISSMDNVTDPLFNPFNSSRKIHSQKFLLRTRLLSLTRTLPQLGARFRKPATRSPVHRTPT